MNIIYYKEPDDDMRDEVNEFIANCIHSKRSINTNLMLLCKDNPEKEDIEYFTQVARLARKEFDDSQYTD